MQDFVKYKEQLLFQNFKNWEKKNFKFKTDLKEHAWKTLQKRAMKSINVSASQPSDMIHHTDLKITVF